ncbi:protease inhibitor I42 family protein [Streptomyces daliensis]|uniref:Protease inhibitor I42 family protein n=1 Tax=Streptomyces daliensis TaxID=299421 RepID=A0A8T4IRN1_9ACTN|nr:protease inhibitor I42 family protein [Streptomyces daliensis]
MPRKRLRPLLVTAVVVAVVAVLVGGYTVFGALTGPQVYDADDTSVSVAPGETFSLQLEENASTGYRWRVEEPEPDADVVTGTGSRYEADEPVLVGSGGGRYLDFRAGEPGHTKIKLLYCRQCGTPDEDTGSPEATTVTFDVTVQD